MNELDFEYQNNKFVQEAVELLRGTFECHKLA